MGIERPRTSFSMAKRALGPEKAQGRVFAVGKSQRPHFYMVRLGYSMADSLIALL